MEIVGIPPETRYDAVVWLPSSEFCTICSDLEHIGDTVVISVTEDGIQFTTKGEIGTINIFLRAVVVEMKEAVSLKFALRKMERVTKATSSPGTLKIRLSSQLPVVFEYKKAELAYINFYCTVPRLESE